MRRMCIQLKKILRDDYLKSFSIMDRSCLHFFELFHLINYSRSLRKLCIMISSKISDCFQSKELFAKTSTEIYQVISKIYMLCVVEIHTFGF